MRPFQLPNGAITPDWLKAMVLRLDDSDDEAEQQIRMALERRSERDLRRALRDLQETLFPEGWGEFVDPNIEATRIQQQMQADQALRDAVSRALQDGVDLGVSVAVDQMGKIGLGFDYTLAHIPARDWALRHTDELLAQLGTTTQRGVGQAIARWVDNGEPLSALQRDLEVFFNPQRAALVASTEVTRAYARGSAIAYQQTGLISRPPRETPPDSTHPGCRCWLTLGENDQGDWVYFWNTANDERVCPICGPKQGIEV